MALRLQGAVPSYDCNKRELALLRLRLAGDVGMKTDDLFSPRSRALGHVAIMYNGQHGPDAEVENPITARNPANLADSGILNTYTATPIARRQRLASIQAEAVSILIVRQRLTLARKQDYPARTPASRGNPINE